VSAAARLAAFVVLLGAVFAVATLAGAAIQPSPRSAAPDEDRMGAEHEDAGAPHAPEPVRGLAVADDGLRLDLATPQLEPDAAGTLRFRILGRDGRALRDFDLEHERRMHVIVVRRDLTEFAHLHPQMAPDGTWSVPLRVAEPGTYRVLADFSHDGTARTLGADLRVSGDAALSALPAPARTADAGDGLRVTLTSPAPGAGREAELRFAAVRDGRPVTPEPYLGARGHLVALREGDLAFLHVHPTTRDGSAFAVTFPTAGAHRLFLQLRVDGHVHTAAFTLEVPR
jgi:hypothetical protein